ncbi:MAG: HAMP domain-containing histidine kinase [Alphaproteobacteria bacterium]|nr:HAMP domain-containing histidine kinase [Alphaproteobacteria bacterium]
MKTLEACEQKGVLATVLWRVVPPSCAALLAIWLLVGIGGVWVLNQRNVESLEAAAEQQTWAVADKIDHFFDNFRAVADNALTINAFVDPLSVEHFLQPFFRSYRIGEYRSLSILMTDFSGQVMASNRSATGVVDLLPRDLWLTPAIDGKEVLTIHEGALVAAVPVKIGSLPEGAILVTLSPADTEALLSSKKHGGSVRLQDRDKGVIFDGDVDLASPSADMIESATLSLPDFPGLALSSRLAPREETPFIGLLHGFLLIAFLADLVALAFGIYMAAKLVASPLNKLIGRIQSMQELTDPNERLEVEGPKELRNLALAFNEAVDRQASLMSSLEKALAKEKDINETQRQFVSLVSHEFRTPLAIIDGQAQRVIRRIDKESPEGIAASMGKCRSSVARLIGLIESVLSSSRLEAGALEFNPGPCKLVELLLEVARTQEGICPSHRVLCDLDQLPADIVADEKMVRQIFTNLLSNAVKYSPKASEVWVKGCQEGAEVVIAVRDRGVGIPKDEIDKLFAQFFRASTASGIAGTGIGLHLVKRLVEMHGGAITVSSVANEGTTFTLRLPIEQPSDAAVKAA